MTQFAYNRRSGLTLVELLVVILIIVVFASLFLPFVQQSRIKDNRSRCRLNLWQIGLASVQAHDQYKRLPPLFSTADSPYGGVAGASLLYHLLPFVEEMGIYSLGPADIGATPIRQNSGALRLTIFLCPTHSINSSSGYYTDTSGTWGASNYAASYPAFGKDKVKLPDSFPDGTATTILFAEKFFQCPSHGSLGGSAWAFGPASGTVLPGCINRAAVFGFRLDGNGNAVEDYALYQDTRTAERRCDPFKAQAPHTNDLINVCMADASVREVRQLTIRDPDQSYRAQGSTSLSWRAALTPDSGPDPDKVGRDWDR